MLWVSSSPPWPCHCPVLHCQCWCWCWCWCHWHWCWHCWHCCLLPSLPSLFLLMEMVTGPLAPIPPCEQGLAVVGGRCWAAVLSSCQAAPIIHLIQFIFTLGGMNVCHCIVHYWVSKCNICWVHRCRRYICLLLDGNTHGASCGSQH